MVDLRVVSSLPTEAAGKVVKHGTTAYAPASELPALAARCPWACHLAWLLQVVSSAWRWLCATIRFLLLPPPAPA